ncbi:MAG: Holliday junction branch migration protein RuvA [Gammaproteobacteria bacterium]|nr:Holliday junction branch migration protein RuvA [Gammaproteobacteria bacterium]
MIGRLSGILIHKQPPGLVVDVQGVGYEIEAPMSTFYVLPALGESVSLWIHTHVREDALQLYGFMADADRSLFRELIKVSGVGARMALTILSGMDAAAFIQCVQREDAALLTRLPGVGTKTAQRLIIELKDRLKNAHVSLPQNNTRIQVSNSSPVDEAVNALIALGYKPAEASRMIAKVEGASTEGSKEGSKEESSVEDLIRQALKQSVRPSVNK